MSLPGTKRCVVVYATRNRHLQWQVDLNTEATIADALAAASKLAGDEEIPWDRATVGVFGEIRSRDAIPLDGDRIEIYRPLTNDPRERRRQRVRQFRGSGEGSSSDG